MRPPKRSPISPTTLLALRDPLATRMMIDDAESALSAAIGLLRTYRARATAERPVYWSDFSETQLRRIEKTVAKLRTMLEPAPKR